MALASSSSSGAGQQVFRVGLYSTNGKTKIADVDLPSPLPAIVQYAGNYYAYSPFYYSRYVQAAPFVAGADLGGRPPASVLAFPQY